MANLMVLHHLWCISFTICRYGFSTIQNNQPVSKILDKTLDYSMPTGVAFIDYEETFDCVSQEYLNKPLNVKNAPIIYRNVMDCIYSSDGFVVVLNRDGQYFRNRRSVRQGDTFSPALFSYVMEEMFASSNWKNKKNGILIEQNGVAYLWFKDDLVLLASDPRDLEDILTALQEDSQFTGLTINEDVYVAYSEHVDMLLNKKPVFYVEEIIYQERFITYRDRNGDETNRRLTLTSENFWAFLSVPKNKMIPVSRRGTLLDSGEIPCLTYDCKTWALTKEPIKKLTGCYEALKWKCGRRMIHGRDESLSEVLTVWTPYPGRGKNRKPRTKWADNMVYTETDWYAVVKNKPKCKDLGDPFAH